MTATKNTDAWGQITMQEIRIVTAAVAGGIYARGESFGYLVCDASGEGMEIAVSKASDLHELLPTLRPASITLDCTDAERPALTELVGVVMQDRRVVEARH